MTNPLYVYDSSRHQYIVVAPWFNPQLVESILIHAAAAGVKPVVIHVGRQSLGDFETIYENELLELRRKYGTSIYFNDKDFDIFYHN